MAGNDGIDRTIAVYLCFSSVILASCLRFDICFRQRLQSAKIYAALGRSITGKPLLFLIEFFSFIVNTEFIDLS